MDKTITNAYYEIELDHKSGLPRRIHVTVLTGTRGSTEVDKKKKIISGEHVAFHFEYRLSKFDDVEAVEVPRGARRLLAKR